MNFGIKFLSFLLLPSLVLAGDWVPMLPIKVRNEASAASTYNLSYTNNSAAAVRISSIEVIQREGTAQGSIRIDKFTTALTGSKVKTIEWSSNLTAGSASAIYNLVYGSSFESAWLQRNDSLDIIIAGLTTNQIVDIILNLEGYQP